MSAWKSKFKFCNPICKPISICGEQKNFYAMSSGLAQEVSPLIEPLTQMLGTVFGGNTDQTRVNREVQKRSGGDEGDFEIENESTIAAVNSELAKVRFEQRSSAIRECVKSILSPAAKSLLGRVLIDTFADEFPRDKQEGRPSPEEMVDAIPLPNMPDVLKGVWEVNKGVFGPLAEQIEQAALDRQSRILKSSETVAASLAGKAGTAGKPSETASSGSPDASPTSASISS